MCIQVAIFYIVTAAVLFINFVWVSGWSFWRPKMSDDMEKAFRNHSVASFPMPTSPRETRDSIAGFEFETPFTRKETNTLGTGGWNTAPVSPRTGMHSHSRYSVPGSPTGTAHSAFEFTTPSTRTGTTVIAEGPEDKEKEKLQFGAIVGPQ